MCTSVTPRVSAAFLLSACPEPCTAGLGGRAGVPRDAGWVHIQGGGYPLYIPRRAYIHRYTPVYHPLCPFIGVYMGFMSRNNRVKQGERGRITSNNGENSVKGGPRA